MPYITSSTDGALLHYVDYVPTIVARARATESGTSTNSETGINTNHDEDHIAARPNFRDRDITLVFIHGWPMSHRMYEHLLLRLCEDHGVRCVASDRRGFGSSEWSGSRIGKGVDGKNERITYQTFAQDTLDLLDHVDGLGKFYFVAASMGCGETVLAYQSMSAEMKDRCLGFVWLGPSLPFPLQTSENPTAPSRELWDAILKGFRDDRVGFTRASLPGVFGVGDQFEQLGMGIEVSKTVLERFEHIVNMADALAVVRCVQIITQWDFAESLRALDGEAVKVLCIHGKCDLGMPAEASALIIPTLAKQVQVKLYEKAAHGLYLTHADQVMDDILDFVFGK